MAPEVLTGDYDMQADLWSIGVLLYTLVSGYLPFQGENSQIVFEKIKKGDFHFKHKEFEVVSDECKDLIKLLLAINPAKRLTGTQALQHRWFKKFGKSQVLSDHIELNNNVIESLRQYKGVSYLKKTVLNQLVKMADDKEVHDLRVSF
jgi:serine/threonine protein kinase